MQHGNLQSHLPQQIATRRTAASRDDDLVAIENDSQRRPGFSAECPYTQVLVVLNANTKDAVVYFAASEGDRTFVEVIGED